ncbi:TPA: hypothetical protein UL921_001189 [Stenotrophomonas maltophilia]|nr:hypothetical protein [Stenotrophomonas maltophilia]
MKATVLDAGVQGRPFDGSQSLERGRRVSAEIGKLDELAEEHGQARERILAASRIERKARPILENIDKASQRRTSRGTQQEPVPVQLHSRRLMER